MKVRGVINESFSTGYRKSAGPKRFTISNNNPDGCLPIILLGCMASIGLYYILA